MDEVENTVDSPKPRAKLRERAKTSGTGPVTTIYIGPTLARGKLTQYTTFRGALPKRISDMISANPKLARLIVPIAKLAEAQARVKTQGTPEYSAVQSIKEE